MILPRENFRFFYEAVSLRFADNSQVLVSGEVKIQCPENLEWAIQADCMNHHEHVDWETLSVSEVRRGD